MASVDPDGRVLPLRVTADGNAGGNDALWSLGDMLTSAAIAVRRWTGRKPDRLLGSTNDSAAWSVAVRMDKIHPSDGYWPAHVPADLAGDPDGWKMCDLSVQREAHFVVIPGQRISFKYPGSVDEPFFSRNEANTGHS